MEGDGDLAWLTVAIPHRNEGLTFRGRTWFNVLEKVHEYLVACIVCNPEAAAQAAAAAKLGSS